MTIHELDFTLIYLVLTLIEIIGAKLMIPFFYKFGITFHKESFTENVIINHELNKTINRTYGKYKFISKSKCIFTAKIHLSKSIFLSNDDITVSKNICNIRGNQVEIISQFPLIPALCCIYIIFIQLFGLLQNNKNETFNLIFPIASLVVITILYFVELNKFYKLKKELNELLLDY